MIILKKYNLNRGTSFSRIARQAPGNVGGQNLFFNKMFPNYSEKLRKTRFTLFIISSCQNTLGRVQRYISYILWSQKDPIFFGFKH